MKLPLGPRSWLVVLPDGAPRFSGPQGREADITEVLATAGQTGRALGMYRQTIAPKSGPPTHIHQTEDEFFYVVSGEFKIKLGDRIMSAPAQSVIFVPSGNPARLRECRDGAWGVAGRRDPRRV
jgi:mannose-6-phosphate isomerase-like protein (cupin superfamily)